MFKIQYVYDVNFYAYIKLLLFNLLDPDELKLGLI